MSLSDEYDFKYGFYQLLGAIDFHRDAVEDDFENAHYADQNLYDAAEEARVGLPEV